MILVRKPEAIEEEEVTEGEVDKLKLMLGTGGEKWRWMMMFECKEGSIRFISSLNSSSLIFC